MSAQAGYYGPLDQNPILGQTQLTDPTLQAIQNRLASQLESDPILNGTQRPHPGSASVRGHLQPWQIAADTIHGVVDQMVVDPVKGLVQTWQKNPGQGLLETLGIVGAVGGLAVLGATAPAAIPALMLGAGVLGGALSLPAAINAWSEEIAHPTDQNLTKALVSTSVAGLSMSPIKSLRSLGQARGLLEAGMQASKEATTAREATSLFLGGADQAARMKGTQPLQKQVEVLGLEPDTLIDQFQRRGINIEKGPASHLLELHQELEQLQAQLKGAVEGGQKRVAAKLRAEIAELAQGPLLSSRLQVAHNHTFLPNQPNAHIPMTPLANVDIELQKHIDKQAGGIRGSLRDLGYGASLGTGVLQPVEKAAEKLASSRAGGGGRYAAEQQYLMWAETRDKGKFGEAQVQSMLEAMESPDHWDRLTPDEKAFAQMTRDIIDQTQVNNMKHGIISVAAQGRAPRYHVGVGTENPDLIGTEPLLSADDWTHEGIGNPHQKWQAAISDEGFVHYELKPLHEEIAAGKDSRFQWEQSKEHQQILNQNADEIRKYRASMSQLNRYAKRPGQQGLDSAAKVALKRVEIASRLGNKGLELVLMDQGAIGKIRHLTPPTRQLLTGSAVIKRLLYNHAHIQEMASFRAMLEGHADLGMKAMKDAMPGLKETHWGSEMQLPTSRVAPGEFPEILPETVFLGDGKSAAEDVAQTLGYFKIHGAVGTSRDIHYRPALYALDDPKQKGGSLARQILKASDEATNYGDLQKGVMGLLFKIGNLNRRLVMLTPFWHAFNVAGRAIGYALSDPIMAKAGLKEFSRLIHDPEEYHAMMTEFGMAGGIHADRHGVGEQIKRLAKEEDGQSRFPGAVRTFTRPIGNAYWFIEDGFWRQVDQFQLLAYVTAKGRIAKQVPGIAPTELRMAAAQYANNLGGMVNPLYMNQVWRQIRGMLWFAPSYWSTFMRAMASSMPGSARLSNFLAKRDGAKFLRMSAVPLRSIDYRTRIELTRANRDFFTMYMATSFVAADLFNLIGSGRHIWDNEQGHTFDIDVSNFLPPGKNKAGATQKNYLAGVPFFRQGADIANGLGVGHNWGFSHTVNDENWQQMDAYHKTSMLFGSILDGAKKEAVNKTAFPVQGAYELATGEKMGARLGQGVQRQVPRLSALVAFLPTGSVMQRAAAEYGQPTAKPVQETLKGMMGTAFGQYTGLPSVYQMGAERAPIDDSKFLHWKQERDDSHKRLLGFSNALLEGRSTPVEYVRHKEAELQRMSQLSRDTWPEHTNSSTSLDNARAKLKDQFGLNELGISQDDWFARYDLFQNAWDQTLQTAAPEARAQWWDHATAQWTDADYLEWQAKQLKTALAASIDGQGGKYIAAYQNRLYALYPRLSRQDYKTIEEGDPYFSAYKTLLGQMATTSPLGAFVSAFSPTQSNVIILPSGLSEQDAQAWAEYTGKTVIRGETATELARQAHLAAQEPGMKQAAGKGITPAAQQAVTEASNA